MIGDLEGTEKILKEVLGYEVRLSTDGYGFTGISVVAGEIPNSLASRPDDVLKIIKQCASDILSNKEKVTEMHEQIANLQNEIRILEKYKTYFEMEKELRGTK